MRRCFFLLSIIFTISLLSACSNNENKKIFTKFEDMENGKIGVILGSSDDFYISKKFPNAKILRFDATSNQLVALQKKKVDFIVVDRIQYFALHSTEGKYSVLVDSILPEPLAIAFPKNEDVLVKQFNLFLKEFRESGELDKMVEKWGEPDGDPQIPDLSDIPRSGKPLIAAASGEWELFDFIKDGKNTGMDIEIVERFAATIGRPIEFFNVSYSSLIPVLTTGKCDMLAASMAVTAERQKTVQFADPYFVSYVSIIVRKENHPDNLSSKANSDEPEPVLLGDGSDVATSTIGVLTGSTSEIFVKSSFPDADIKCFDDVSSALAALSAQKVKYVFTCYTTEVCAARHNKELYVLPKSYTDDSSYIALQKNCDPELLNGINGCIRKMRENGTLEEMENRWIRSTSDNYEMPNLPENHFEKVLRVGTSADREPMIFIQNGKITGFDWELISRIAYDLQMRVEFTDMKFASMIAALSSDRIDAIVSNFSYTKERAKQVTFTDSYFYNPQKFITKQKLEKKVAKTPFFTQLKNSFESNLVTEKRYMLIVDGLWNTIIISLFSLIFGTLLGSGICAMRMSRRKFLSKSAIVYIDFMRGIPTLVLLMIMFYVIFAKSHISAVNVAILTFGLNFAAYSSEIFRTAIHGVGTGQKEAGIALGFNKLQTFLFIIFPQAVKTALPVYKGEMISLIKMTSIVGYVAVQDLTKASDIIRSRTFDAFFPLILVAVIYFILAWLFAKGLELSFRSSDRHPQKQ